MKAALFFLGGLVVMMSVLGGIEQSVDIGIIEALQFIALTLVALAMLSIGISYAKESSDK